jgi:threonylcarbamoyladenosine tRNA methylthiotransferase MtaB
MLIKNKTFYIVTIGCRTNACESDIINNQLINESAIRANSLNEANIVIVNTCCVTAKAESKSKYYINQAIRSTRCELVIMVGCLSQVNTKLFHHPKIGIVIGNKVKNKLIDYIRKYKHNQPIVDIKKFSKTDVFDSYDSINFLNKTRAFVKIQDGCDCMCSYCIIPFVRGRQRSLEHHKVLSIINQLVKNGHQEIVLTGVNTAGYRENNKYGFWELLKDINKLKGNFRVRISSLEPFQIDKRIIDLLTDNPKR